MTFYENVQHKRGNGKTLISEYTCNPKYMTDRVMGYL